MRKRFIVLLNTTTAEQNTKFRDEFIKPSFGWWHWFPDCWLLTDAAGRFTAAAIRDEVRKHFSGSFTLVVELRDDGTDTWSGFGMNTAEKNMFKWIKENWEKKS